MSLIVNTPTISVLQDIRLTATAATNFFLPSSAVIREIIASNTTVNAVTGGIKIGTTAGGTDVVTALAVAASANTYVTDANLSKRYFSQSSAQQIFIDAVTGWNSASVQIDILYYQL